MDNYFTTFRNRSLVAYILLFGSMIAYTLLSYTVRNGVYTRNNGLSTVFILLVFLSWIFVVAKDVGLPENPLKTKILIADMLVIFALIISILIYPTSFMLIKGLIVLSASFIYLTVFMKLLYSGKLLEVMHGENALVMSDSLLAFEKLSLQAYVIWFVSLWWAVSGNSYNDSAHSMRIFFIGNILAVIIGLMMIVAKNQKIGNAHMKAKVIYGDLLITILLVVLTAGLPSDLGLVKDAAIGIVMALYLRYYLAEIYHGKIAVQEE